MGKIWELTRIYKNLPEYTVWVVNAIFLINLDWGKERSVSGQLITLFGSAVSWKSYKVLLQHLLVTWIEYIAACEAAREIVWVRMLLKEVGFNIKHPSVVLEDNSAAKITAEAIGISDRKSHMFSMIPLLLCCQ